MIVYHGNSCMINVSPPRIYLATSNPGKIRDFQGVARSLGISVQPLPGLETLAPPAEDGATFEANARIKAEYYSRRSPGNLVAADDSGLMVDALNGAPGVHSARYAAVVSGRPESSGNSDDQENNRLLIAQLQRSPEPGRSGKFVCVIALAQDGVTLQTFRGEARGEILTSPRGHFGFGYDPLFFFPDLGKTFAEIPVEEKALYSHRGQAFRKLLEWSRTAAIGPSAHQLIGSSEKNNQQA
jgi:XTP/dITP diphosphohydrolase